MRLKIDSNRYNAQGVKRRGERNTKPIVEVPKSNRKKSTQKWCRGKIGQEYILECQKYYDAKKERDTSISIRDKWRILVCKKCGKEIDHYYPFGTRFDRKPEWVID